MEHEERLKAALADRYAIQREIGSGGMATVYLAQDLKHNRQVAMKVLKPELAAIVGTERFLREIETAANLTHPHILPLHDSGEVDGFLFYVMPYVGGESLRARLEREKQLPVEDALRISQEVADALSYAHSRGVVHRDVKPANILLEAGHAVVADFGIARAVDEAGGTKLTGTGMAVGTPAYMSPEQAAGSQELDGRSDLYSLGCVLYEMLAGEPPFTGPTRESLIHQHLTGEPAKIVERRPAVSGQVAAALERALSKTPADRFNSVALFAEALGPRGYAATPWSPVTPRPLTSRQSAWRRVAVLGSAAVVVVVAVVVGALKLNRPRGETTAPGDRGYPRTAIAVLPFQNLSADGPFAYFAGGLHDVLLTQLAGVGAISLRGRTSVMGYAGTTKPIRVIARELSVGAIVEGSVQVMGDRLRVVVQLIDATTDEHLWAEQYDRTLDDAFQVQSDIAQRIVIALGAALTEGEAEAIADPPTENTEAYRLYLQGVEYHRRGGRLRENTEAAQHFYERAVELDPNFVQAHAALSIAHGQMSWYGYDPSDARLRQQKAEAELAVELGPEVPQAQYAAAMWHYFGERDWEAALDRLRPVLELLPNEAEAWERVGFIYRRMGRWEDARLAAAKASELNPRSTQVWEDLVGGSFLVTRDYAGAVEAYDRSIGLAPDLRVAAARRGEAYLLWTGDADTLQSVLDGILVGTDLGPLGTERALRAELLLLERKADSLLAMLRDLQIPVLLSQNFYWPVSLFEGWAYRLKEEGAIAETSFRTALAVLDSAMVDGAGDWRLHTARGLALAALGRQREALEEARWLERSVIYREDAYLGPRLMGFRAMILAEAGDRDGALREIERVLSGPGWISAHTLRLDSRWDPIREDPRFQALLEEYADEVKH
ncbi:MAG: protein kinase [Gemmatimonadota bacterium]|jgi:serine/threonine-protein kinase